MNNYLIQHNNKYGILQTDDNMAEVKIKFADDCEISKWDKVEQIQTYAEKQGLEYAYGFDIFYK